MKKAFVVLFALAAGAAQSQSLVGKALDVADKALSKSGEVNAQIGVNTDQSETRNTATASGTNSMAAAGTNAMIIRGGQVNGVAVNAQIGVTTGNARVVNNANATSGGTAASGTNAMIRGN